MLRPFTITTLAALLLSAAAFGAETGVGVTKDIPYGNHPEQVLDVYVPAIVTDDMPLFVLSPTGPKNVGMKGSFGKIGPVFAEKGVIVVAAGYRLIPKAVFPEFIEDAARAVAWSLDAFPTETGDPRALFLAGDGEGAHIAALLALDERWLVAAGVPEGTVTGVIGIAGEYLGGDDCMQEECKLHFPEERRADWATPDFAGPDDPPMLLIAGEKDESEGIDELEELASPAANARIEVTTLVVPRGTGLSLFIDWSRPGTATHDTVSAFIDRLAPR